MPIRILLLLALLLGLVAPAHAFIPVPTRDVITVAFHADTIVVAKPIGKSRWTVLRSLAGKLKPNDEILVATGDWEIADAERAILVISYDASAKAWYPHANGIRTVARGVTYDFYAGDARFEGPLAVQPGEGMLVRGGMVWWVRVKLDTRFDTLVGMFEKATVRAGEAKVAFAAPPSDDRRARLLAVFAEVHYGCWDWEWRFDHLDKMIVDDFVKSRDIAGLLGVEKLWKPAPATAVPCLRPTEDGLRAGAFDNAQPDALRILVLRRGVVSDYQLFNFFIFKDTVAVQLEASAQIAAFRCDKENRRYVTSLIADALKDETEPAIIANLNAGAKRCSKR